MDSFSFLLGMAFMPDTIVDSEPAMDMSQYVLYLMSLAGSWFGISIVTLNPVKIFKYFKKQNNLNGNQSLQGHDLQSTETIICLCINNERRIQLLKLKHDYEMRTIRRDMSQMVTYIAAVDMRSRRDDSQ